MDGYYLGFALSNVHTVQPKAWTDSETMLEWVDKVWKSWTLTKNSPTMLIIDEYKVHMTTEVHNAIANCGTHLEFVPAGYTSKLQVMDVGLNKPFKEHFCNTHDEWFMMVEIGTKPQCANVSCWVKASWDRITNSAISNTWHKVGLPKPEDEGSEAECDSDSESEDFLSLRSLGVDNDNGNEDSNDKKI